jgi:hypothetical protein
MLRRVHALRQDASGVDRLLSRRRVRHAQRRAHLPSPKTTIALKSVHLLLPGSAHNFFLLWHVSFSNFQLALVVSDKGGISAREFSLSYALSADTYAFVSACPFIVT